MLESRLNVLFRSAQDHIDCGDYAGALRVARSAKRSAASDWRAGFNYAGVLVDCGIRVNNGRQIRAGLRAMRALISAASPEIEPVVRYNLGSAYLAIGQRQRGVGPLTRPALALAINELARSELARPSSEAKLNLAIAFNSQGRCIEAIDILNDLSKHNPQHAILHASRSDALGMTHGWLCRHSGLIRAALADAETALALAKTTDLRSALRLKVDRLRRRCSRFEPESSSGADAYLTPFELWCWETGLALNPCPHCRGRFGAEMDRYVLNGLLAGGTRRPTEAELVEIVNAWHRCYSTARWNLFQATECAEDLPGGQVVYARGLDKTKHGLQVGLLLAAVNGFHSILGQIAFGLNSYLHLQHPRGVVDFARMWSDPGRKRASGSDRIPIKRTDLHARLRGVSSRSLSALFNLAVSIETAGGMYEHLRILRNWSEHRVVVVEDSDGAGSRYFHRVGSDDLKRQAVALGRLAKAAIWYSGGVLWWCEAQRAKRADRAGALVQSRGAIGAMRSLPD